MAVPPALVALRAFVHAAEDLDAVWSAGDDVSALATQYPRGLPRFDALVEGLIAWRDAVAGALGAKRGGSGGAGAGAGDLPAGWREGHEGDVACPHRDCSVCPDCSRREEVVEVYGRHFWIPAPLEREALRGRCYARRRP
jgi:hypothetical protein